MLAALCVLSFTASSSGDRPVKQAAVVVSPRGNDSTCARNSPARTCASWGQAYRVALPGDLIEIQPGTYGNQTLVHDPAKRSSQSVTFRGSGSVLLQGVLGLGADTGSNSGAAPSNVAFERFEVRGHIRQMWTTGATIRPINLAFRNVRIRYPNVTGLPLLTLSAPDRVTLSNVELGPSCCNSSAIVLGMERGNPNPSNITFDRVYVHDITDNCSYYPEPGCNGLPAPNLDVFHVDCLQAYGGDRITIRRSRFFNCATQAIFAGTEGGGTFSNWTIENTMVGGIPRGRDGAQSNHAIFFGNQEGRPYLFGSFRFAYNTLNVDQSASFVIDPVGSVASDARFVVAGNIAYWDPPCTLAGRWTFRNNLFPNKTCDNSDRRARPTFVRSDVVGPDLTLKPGSRGLGGGEATLRPLSDIDGKLRPVRARADVGASQLETAEIVLGRSIGDVVMGQSEAAVAAAYGRAVRVRSRGGTRIATYRRQGHGLTVTAARGRVIGVATSSKYYSTRSGVGPGSRLTSGFRWSACAKAYVRTGPRTETQLVVRGTRRAIRLVSIVSRGHGSC